MKSSDKHLSNDDKERRQFLKASAVSTLAAGTGVYGVSNASDTPALAGRSTRYVALPKAHGPRVVVVGGGWSGLTIAKYLKRNHPVFDVVLVERKSGFVSCPLSNLWLADQIDLELLSHSYLDAAKNHNYLFLNATVIDADRIARKIFTDMGIIDYEYLVLAPGIDYNYGKLGIEDPAEEYQLRLQFPGGFKGISELIAIKHKLHQFKGGDFLMTVPSGNYRCMAAPYERACMAAAVFKKRKINARVVLLDMNPDVRIKSEGFHLAWKQYYSDVIHYESGIGITAIDPFNKIVETDFDEYGFDDAVIYPPIRASRLIEDLGLMSQNSLQKEADIHPFKYHMMDDERVYVTGDSRSQPFSKSGNTAHSEAKYVAEVITAHVQRREIPWRSPQTMCFSGVMIDPVESMSIISSYKFNQQEDRFQFDRVHPIQKWSERMGQAGFAWAEGMYKDMFYN